MSIADAAIARMRGPRNMHIICIDVTNKCDLACSNCTRLLENQDHFWDITPENFRLALRSLKGYWGVIAMIGGNPCMHKNFAELCQIFEEEVPNKLQRGLWTNNYFKHRELCEKTFGTFNLNSHGEQRAEEGLTELATVARSTGGVAWNYSGHSDHAPLLTAVKDLYPEQEMWDRISNCDINREWSASIVQNKGELRAYFCEVAASFDLARGTDHGMPLTEGWWNKQITDFSDQVKRFCPGCGVPAKQKGNKDYEEIDTYTDSNADLAVKSLAKKNRKIIHLDATQKEEVNKRVTLYNSGQ
jgi:organic radical activating enzyme